MSSHKDLNKTRVELKSIEKGSLFYAAREYNTCLNEATFLIPPREALVYAGDLNLVSVPFSYFERQTIYREGDGDMLSNDLYMSPKLCKTMYFEGDL